MREHSVFSNHVDFEIRIGQPLKVRDERLLGQTGGNRLFFEPDSAEKTVFRKPLEMVFERGLAWFEVSYNSDDQ
jgi:hypothetical protein